MVREQVDGNCRRYGNYRRVVGVGGYIEFGLNQMEQIYIAKKLYSKKLL